MSIIQVAYYPYRRNGIKKNLKFYPNDIIPLYAVKEDTIKGNQPKGGVVHQMCERREAERRSLLYYFLLDTKHFGKLFGVLLRTTEIPELEYQFQIYIPSKNEESTGLPNVSVHPSEIHKIITEGCIDHKYPVDWEEDPRWCENVSFEDIQSLTSLFTT